MLVQRHNGRGDGWLADGLGLAASLAANVVAADRSLVDPDVVRRVTAGWPPVALAIFAGTHTPTPIAGSHGGPSERASDPGGLGLTWWAVIARVTLHEPAA